MRRSITDAETEAYAAYIVDGEGKSLRVTIITYLVAKAGLIEDLNSPIFKRR